VKAKDRDGEQGGGDRAGHDGNARERLRGGLLDVQQHDDEEEQRGDGAGVNEDEHEREEVGLEHDEQAGDADEREHEAHRGVDGVLVQHRGERGDDREKREEVEEERGH